MLACQLRFQMNPHRMSLLLSMEHCVYWKRLVSPCFTCTTDRRLCCGRLFSPRALLQASIRCYSSAVVRRNATRKEDQHAPQSILKRKGKGKGAVSVNLPETKKEVLAFLINPLHLTIQSNSKVQDCRKLIRTYLIE